LATKTSRPDPSAPQGGAPSPLQLAAILQRANELIGETELLYNRVATKQRSCHRRSVEAGLRVDEAVQEDVARMHIERDHYETELAEHLRQIHHLEVTSMEIMDALRERRLDTRVIAEHFQRLKDDGEPPGFADNEFRTLRDVGRRLEVQVQELQAKLSQTHKDREIVEARLAELRHALAIHEMLEKSRSEKRYRRTPFDDPAMILVENSAHESSDHQS